jgi:5-methylcytosine-specific restriction endonuclease McrA
MRQSLGGMTKPVLAEERSMTEAEIREVFARPKPRATETGTRRSLTPRQRAHVFAKTAGTCHVCGGEAGKGWQADHVIPHQHGGAHSLDNYLPICKECNRLRWSYRPEVLRLMLRLGVYIKHEIRHDTKLGRRLIKLATGRLRRSGKRRVVPV